MEGSLTRDQKCPASRHDSSRHVPRACGGVAQPAACADAARGGPQVRLLEAFILSVTLISALLTGTCMLHMLCTPTRFEAPKGERSHGDT